jgi:hypothetical protein
MKLHSALPGWDSRYREFPFCNLKLARNSEAGFFWVPVGTCPEVVEGRARR